MKCKVKVYGNGTSFIGTLPGVPPRFVSRQRKQNKIRELLEKYYNEAHSLQISKKDIKEYLFNRMLNEENQLMTPSELEEFVKYEANKIHHRVKRYRRKFAFFHPNYFVTFTYSNDKITPELFERKLKRALSNFAFRNNWRYIGAKEKGDENGRVHFHFLIDIPEGEMVGELFEDYHWNEKTHKREKFINNTYFNKRFGFAEFDKIESDTHINGSLQNYLIKYIIKQNVRLIYSRHLPTEKEMEIDLDNDVFLTFRDFSSIKVYLPIEYFYSEEQLRMLGYAEFFLADSGGMGFDPTVCYKNKFAS